MRYKIVRITALLTAVFMTAAAFAQTRKKWKQTGLEQKFSMMFLRKVSKKDCVVMEGNVRHVAMTEITLTNDEIQTIGELFAPGRMHGGVPTKMHYVNGIVQTK